MSRSSEYVDKFAEYAIEQQQKYGIPASVTLAQGLLESANGHSQLSRECNNHFGIKAGKSWIDSGGQYGLYTDAVRMRNSASTPLSRTAMSITH